jgi:hypothetical protein
MKKRNCGVCFAICNACWTRSVDSPFFVQQAINYARWLAQRGGIALPTAWGVEPKVYWDGVYGAHNAIGKPYKKARYERRARAVAWGRYEDRYNTRKDGKRGAWTHKEFVEEVRIDIPNWDFILQPAVEAPHE